MNITDTRNGISVPSLSSVFVDDRTPEQKKTHCVAVVGTDSFMSYWGHARNGLSYAGWACTPDDLNAVESWVRSRSDMKRVRIVSLDGYRPSRATHTHIYVVDKNHPARS
ncbi:hypothetical protein LCGC14_1130210 [marine sediment metagenome]|uniref:Uncharacterized protein n=1 Tax=marine sediment metagenome TaxID=412755 RepID=A0A0F9M178_9ZZZZ